MFVVEREGFGGRRLYWYALTYRDNRDEAIKVAAMYEWANEQPHRVLNAAGRQVWPALDGVNEESA